MPTPVSRLASVGTRLVVATSLVMTMATAAVYVVLSRFEEERMIGAKEQAVRMAGGLFLRHASTPVVFDDPAGIQDAVNLLGSDPEVLSIEIWQGGGRRISAHFKNDPLGVSFRWVTNEVMERRSDRILYRDAIRGPDGEVIAVVAVQYSLAHEQAGIAELRSRILVVAAGAAALLTLLLSWVTRRWIVGPVERLLGAVRQLEAGEAVDLTAGAGRDEVGRLGDAFARMAAAVARRERDIVGRNRELLVVLRREVESRAALLSLVNNTENLIALCDAEGRLVVANAPFRALSPEHFEAGVDLVEQLPESWRAEWRRRFAMVLEGERSHFEQLAGARVLEVSLNPILGDGGETLGITFFAADISERRAAEAKNAAMQRDLVAASRLGGMAEVATAVLHNVGNVLNSVNVSANVLCDAARDSKVQRSLSRAVELLRQNGEDLVGFFSQERGKRLPEFLDAVSRALEQERSLFGSELSSLQKNIDHIKVIVALQQSHARPSRALEMMAPSAVLDEAVAMDGALGRASPATVRRDYQAVGEIETDHHKLLQILVNLLRNARQASEGGSDPTVTVRLYGHGEDRVRFEVIDHGCGILPQDLSKIFTYGFTTKRDGHGFGLHASACAAGEMGGTLTAYSDGAGRGATFTLELPRLQLKKSA